MIEYDFGGLLSTTICVDVCPPAPTISFPTGPKLIVLGVAIATLLAPPFREPPPTGNVRSPPCLPTRKYFPYGTCTDPKVDVSHSPALLAAAISCSSLMSVGTSTDLANSAGSAFLNA